MIQWGRLRRNEVHKHGVEEMKVTLEQNCFSFPPLSLPLLFVLCCALPQHLCEKREGSYKVLGLISITTLKIISNVGGAIL